LTVLFCGTTGASQDMRAPAWPATATSVDIFIGRNPFTEDHSHTPADPRSASEIEALFTANPGRFDNFLELAMTAHVHPGLDPAGQGASPAFAIYECRDHRTACRPYVAKCKLYSDCPLQGKTVWAPPGAYPEQGCGEDDRGHIRGECHTEIVDYVTRTVTGWYVMGPPFRVRPLPLYEFLARDPGPLIIGYGGTCPFDAYDHGRACNLADTAGGIPVVANLVRPEELESAIARKGDLGHSLYVAACGSAPGRWPATRRVTPQKNGANCPPQGAFIVLRNWSEERIDATEMPEVARVFYRTLAKYGYIVSDNLATPLSLGFEDLLDRPPTEWYLWDDLMHSICAEDRTLDCTVSRNSYHTYLPILFSRSDLVVIQSPR
jgi:hypothetical protein